MNFNLKALERLQSLLSKGLKNCLGYSVGWTWYVNGGKGGLGNRIREVSQVRGPERWWFGPEWL